MPHIAQKSKLYSKYDSQTGLVTKRLSIIDIYTKHSSLASYFVSTPVVAFLLQENHTD